MNTIYLVRHAEYNNPHNLLVGRLPVELSEKGIQQAQKLHDYFSNKNIARIYTSAVLRCKQTADIISNNIIPIIIDKRILETLSAYQGYWGENEHEGGYHFFSNRNELGGESLVDLQKRMADFWDDVTSNLNGNIIICSHGDPIQTLYSYIVGEPLVDENASEDSIPGWIEKGEFIEVAWSDGRVVEVKSKKQL